MKSYLRTLGCTASLLLALASSALAADTPNASPDEIGIRTVMLSIWDNPQARLDIAPVVIVEDWAIAGWVQGERGGRALLRRDAHGQWQVSVCGGDGLKDAKVLELTGMSAHTAHALAQQVEHTEASLPAARRALFATFEGMLRMDGAGNHPPEAAAGGHTH